MVDGATPLETSLNTVPAEGVMPGIGDATEPRLDAGIDDDRHDREEQYPDSRP
jgi:hypothetical protein